MSLVNRNFYFFVNLYAFYFSFLPYTALARISSTMLNVSSESTPANTASDIKGGSAVW